VKDAFGGSVFSEDLTTYGGTFAPSEASAVLANGFVLTILPSGTQPPQPSEFSTQLPGDNEGWRMLTAPTENETYADLLDGVWTQGFEGANSSSGAPTVYWYDELTQSWTVPLNASNIIGSSSDSGSSAGKGIIAYIFSDDDADQIDDPWPKEISVTGFPNSGDIDVTLTTTNSPDAEEPGWNLVANPYPLGVNWVDMVSGNALSNVTPVMFVYDANIQDGLGGYRVNYGFNIPGLPSDISHDGTIAPFQAFWARTADLVNSGTISFSESFHLDDNGTIYQEPSSPVSSLPKVGIIIEGNNLTESAVLTFSNESDPSVDKPAPLRAQAIEFGFSLNNDLYSLFNLDLEYGETMSIPLEFGSVRQGTYSISPTGLNVVQNEAGLDIELKIIDHHTQTEHVLTEDSSYSFYFEPSEKTVTSFESMQKQPLDQLTADPAQLMVERVNRFDLVISHGVPTSTEPVNELPTSFMLEQNFPNPFNPSTQIRYALPEASSVSLSVYTVTGQKVASLVSGTQSAGWHHVSFDASGLNSGVYIYRLETSSMVLTKKLTLIK